MEPVANQSLQSAGIMSVITLRGPSSLRPLGPPVFSQQPALAPTQGSQVRGTATHSWQRLTTQHMCTFIYTNAPLYTDYCPCRLACTCVCSVCFVSKIHLNVMGHHSWKITYRKHINPVKVPQHSLVWRCCKFRKFCLSYAR